MKNIIFDWSGVIKDAFNAHHWVVNRIFQKYGLEELSAEELRERWEEPFMVFFNKYLPQQSIEDIQSAYREGVSDKNYPVSETFPGMVALIKKIKGRGDYIAVITSDLPDSFFPELKKFGLDNVFDDVVTKVHEKSDALRELINKNNLNLEDTFIVGDSNNEIMAGKQLGVKSIAVTWGLNMEEKLKKDNPDYVVHTVEELKNYLNMDKQIGLGTQIIIKNEKGEILFSKRSKEFGFGEWELPGGHIEFGETFEQCVTRECKEELGIDVTVSKLVSVAPNMKQGNHYIVFVFLAESFQGTPKNMEPEIHSELTWFPENNLPGNLFIASRDALDNYLSGVIYRSAKQ